MRPVIEVLGDEHPLIVSPTRLQRAACPLSFKLTYLDKTVRPYRRPAAVRGIVAHHAIALLTTRCLDARVLPAELADEDLREAITQAAGHEVFSDLGRIYDWIALWRERFPLRPRDLVGYEERIAIDEQFRWTDWDAASFRGIVDVVHFVGGMRTAIVTDYKSMPNLLSHGALVEHEQGSFYCWLVSKFYPQVEEFIFRVWYLRYGCYVETVRTRRQLEHFEQTMFVKRQMIAALTEWESHRRPTLRRLRLRPRLPARQGRHAAARRNPQRRASRSDCRRAARQGGVGQRGAQQAQDLRRA